MNDEDRGLRDRRICKPIKDFSEEYRDSASRKNPEIAVADALIPKDESRYSPGSPV